MLKIGKDVLQKIESLLVELDNSPNQKKNNKNKKNNFNDQNRQNKSRSKSKSISKQPTPISKSSKLRTSDKVKQQRKPSRSPSRVNNHIKSKPQPLKESNISYRQFNQPQELSSRLNKLYMDHFHKQQRIQEKNTHLIEQQIMKVKQFKVTNKVSKFMNKKKQLKPIHERLDQIILQRQKSMQKLKEQFPLNKQQQQQEQFLQILQYRQKLNPKVNKQQFQERMKQMQMRNFLRMQKLHQQKLNNIQKLHKQTQQKPLINQSSQILYQKTRSKKNLSKNIIQRFQQYHQLKNIQWDNYLVKRMQEETPFTPKINQVSRLIADKSKSRRSLYEKGSYSRSCSCKQIKNISKNKQNKQNSISKYHNLSITDRSTKKPSSFVFQLGQNSRSKHKNSVTTDHTSHLKSNSQNQSSFNYHFNNIRKK